MKNISHLCPFPAARSEIIRLIAEIPEIKPVFIENQKAQYRFERIVQGHMITFPINFVKENGKWKIMDF
jgi:hypothetical protein